MSVKASVSAASSSKRHGAFWSSWRFMLGLLALVPAAVGVATFMTYFSISVQLTKALVYEPGLLTSVYLALPQISTASSAVGRRSCSSTAAL